MQAVKSKQRALPFFISSSSLSACLFPVCDFSQKKVINEIVRKLLGNIDFKGRREANFSVLRHFFQFFVYAVEILHDCQIFRFPEQRTDFAFLLEIAEDFIVKRHACLSLTEQLNKPRNRGRSDKEKSEFDKIAIYS